MIVEFVGSEGVGKSTVAVRVADSLGAEVSHGHRFGDRPGERLPRRRIALERATAVLRNPRLFNTSFRSSSGALKKRLSNAFALVRRDQLARSLHRRGGTHVIDAGAVYALAGRVARGDQNAVRLARYLTRPDVLVLLRADDETLRSRVGQRATVDDVGVPLRTEIPDGWADRHSQAVRAAAGTLGCALVEVDARRAAAEVVDEVVSRLAVYA